MYYAARDMHGQTVCGAAMAQSSDPFGSYLDIGRPLVSATESVGGAIDPHYFKVGQIVHFKSSIYSFFTDLTFPFFLV